MLGLTRSWPKLICLGAVCMVGLWLAGCGKPESAARAIPPTESAVTPAAAPAPSANATPVSASASAPASAPVATVFASATAVALPAEVQAFIAQREACDHFRGEEGYDAERRAFLAKALAKTCTGTDRALAALRERFAAQPAVLAALKDFEVRIE